MFSPNPEPARDRMVEAAHALLGEGGLEGLTIRAVLARSGLARRAFYDRFAGKDDLVLAVFEETIRQAAALLRGRVASLADPIERLRTIVATVAMGDAEPGRLGAAMSREHLRLAEARPAELRAALSPLVDLIADELGGGMDAGIVRRAEPQRLAWLVYNLVSATVHGELLAEESGGRRAGRRAEIAGDVWEFCRRAIIAREDH